jgi:hypothetical protein
MEWPLSFEPAVEIYRKKYTVVANYVPTTFDPKAEGAKTAIYYKNPGTIASPSAVVDVHWLHQQRDSSLKKSASSLMLVLDDIRTADTLIHRSLAVAGTSFPVSRFDPGPPTMFQLSRLSYGQGVS